jgi:hypothetical protein
MVSVKMCDFNHTEMKKRHSEEWRLVVELVRAKARVAPASLRGTLNGPFSSAL